MNVAFPESPELLLENFHSSKRGQSFVSLILKTAVLCSLRFSILDIIVSYILSHFLSLLVPDVRANKVTVLLRLS